MTSFTETLAGIPDDVPALSIPLGERPSGELQMLDIERAPHVLFAGATGSGKSNSINVAIATLMARNTPDRLRFIMIDPKRVELSDYRESEFVDSVITDMDAAAAAIEALVATMGQRYELFEKAHVKKLSAYNKKADKQLPLIVLVIDELADLMDTHSKTVLPLLVRLGQLARAAGIHMILGTQRPAADTIPKKFLANIPTRVGLLCQSHTESRLVIGESGAENLRGNGELMAVIPEQSGIVRAQAPFISPEEIEEVVGTAHAVGESEDAEESEDEEVDDDTPTVADALGGMRELIAEQIAAMGIAPAEPDTSLVDELRAQIADLKDQVAGARAEASMARERTRAADAGLARARESEAMTRYDLGVAQNERDRALRTSAGTNKAILSLIGWTVMLGVIGSVVAGLLLVFAPVVAVAVPIAAGVVAALTGATKAMKNESEAENAGRQLLRSGGPGGDRAHVRADAGQDRADSTIGAGLPGVGVPGPAGDAVAASRH